jgi:hypothetical protein
MSARFTFAEKGLLGAARLNEERLNSYYKICSPKEQEKIYYKALESGKLSDSSRT